MVHSRIIRLKRETTSSDSVVEERRPETRDTAVRRWLKAIIEAGLAWVSNPSNSLSASSRPRLPERAREPMTRSSSKHRLLTALTRPDMPTGRRGAATGPAPRGTDGTASRQSPDRSGKQSSSSTREVAGAARAVPWIV